MKVKDAIELLKNINPEYSLITHNERKNFTCIADGFETLETTSGPVIQLVPGQIQVLRDV